MATTPGYVVFVPGTPSGAATAPGTPHPTKINRPGLLCVLVPLSKKQIRTTSYCTRCEGANEVLLLYGTSLKVVQSIFIRTGSLLTNRGRERSGLSAGVGIPGATSGGAELYSPPLPVAPVNRV